MSAHFSPMPVDPKNTADRTPHRNSVLAELREMQKVAYARVMDEKTEDKDVAQLLRAYVTAEQQRNILRMRPNPKPIDVTELRKARERQKAAAANGAPSGWRSKPRPTADVVPMPPSTPQSASS